VKQKIISATDVRCLLQYSLDHGYRAECASFALVFFCGVRVDEVSRINWDQIQLNGSRSFVDITDGKNSRRRVNFIPANATHWLKACCSHGRIAPTNYEKRMQRLRKKAKVMYPQNCARHCFASYHIAFHEDGAKTASHLRPFLKSSVNVFRILLRNIPPNWKTGISFRGKAGSRIRTDDLLITNQLLYQLSYAGKKNRAA